MADESTLDDRAVVACNGQRRQEPVLSPDAYFCRILRLSAGVLRIGPDGFLGPEEEDEAGWTKGWTVANASSAVPAAACRGWSGAVEGPSSSGGGGDDWPAWSSSSPPLLKNHPNTRGSATSPGLPNDKIGRDETVTTGNGGLAAVCKRLKFATLMRAEHGTPVVHIELDVDRVLAGRTIQTPSGTFTLGSGPAEDDAGDKGGLIVNRDGLYPASDEDPESFRNDLFEVKKSPLGGLGAFARRDLRAGEVILVERALVVADQTTIYDALDALTPPQRGAFARLHAYVRTPNDLCDGRRYATFRTNSFGIPGSAFSPSSSPSSSSYSSSSPSSSSFSSTSNPPSSSASAALFLVASRFNHACPPRSNVEYWFDRSRRSMAFAARRDVPAAAELTITYSRSPLELYGVWGFRCVCGACRPLSDADCAAADAACGHGGGGGVVKDLGFWG
ncbi:hypothetical protein F5X96DRAFT_695490 [Biscogniauxia mediterranea]|nr:hypothetical protein F5X96DRAFT_695490 [Biscogniauxia mediterranea]